MRYWHNKLPDSYSDFPQSILKHELSQILFLSTVNGHTYSYELMVLGTLIVPYQKCRLQGYESVKSALHISPVFRSTLLSWGVFPDTNPMAPRTKPPTGHAVVPSRSYPPTFRGQIKQFEPPHVPFHLPSQQRDLQQYVLLPASFQEPLQQRMWV